MDRNEAVLRELNLYPQWVRKEQPAPDVAEDEGRGTARRAHAGTEASSATTENRAASATDTQPSAMDIAQPVPSTNAGLNPSCESAQAEGRLGGGAADTQHVAAPSADEENNPSFASDMPVEAVHEPAEAAAGDEAGREQLIARLGWPELKTMVRDCTACKLRAGCTQTVFGVGDQQADWLFVGEGPGADEDAKGEPFVGQAGKLLDSMLLALKLKRGDNVYIANIVKCRPPGNRVPEADEIATCIPYLQRQIQLVRPKVIVALGKTAATALLRTGDVSLGSLRGNTHDFEGVPLIVTYHPAYLLRSPLEKARAWQDLRLARRTLQGGQAG